jgi:small subunit ribosomal protein S1
VTEPPETQLIIPATVPRLPEGAVVVERGVGERPAAESQAPEPIAATMPDTDEDFGEMFAASQKRESGGLEPGDRVKGVVEVVSLHGQEVFLDLGGKATGYVLKAELLDETGELTVKQGDVLEGVVMGNDSNGIRIRTAVGRGIVDARALYDAFQAGLPVEGKVVATNKGGYEVMVAGVQAFCPMSQIDLVRPADPETLVGQVLTFKVTELRGRSAVVSRAALMKQDQAERAKQTRELIQPGARLRGRVRSIQKFGVFVDLGGIDGLVHISELAWSRVEDPHEVIALGQEVEVLVLEADEKRERIALSIRQAQGDPFVEAVSGLGVGSVVEGKVARLTNFGAFVTIAQGVDGLIHVSDLAHRHVRHPKEVLEVGQGVRVQVTEIDLERRRVGLSLKSLASDPWDAASTKYQVGQEVTGRVESVQSFGVFVELEPGVTALLPASESATPQGQPLGSAFSVGSEVTCKVLRIEPEARKIAVTRREAASYRPPDAREPGGRQPGARREGGRREPAGRREGGREPRETGARVWKDEGDQGKGRSSQPVGSFGELLLAALKKEPPK